MLRQQRGQKRGAFNALQRGFTLPTVIIVSVMMMALLAAALQLITITRQSLEDQYYNQLAREAAEAGGVYAAECVRQRTYNGASLTPNKTCSGANISGATQYIASTTRYQTTFTATQVSNVSGVRTIAIEGVAQVKRGNTSTVVKSYSHSLNQKTTTQIDIVGSRASKRWWHFGSAVLDFGVAGTDLALGSASSGSPPEGITTVSDRQGNLLFYSDGLSIWNSSHNLMTVSATSRVCTDGTPLSGQGLCGSRTGTQAVASFPINTSETKYVVVTSTVNAKSGGNRGTLYMTVVDFATYADGRIISRNEPVWPGQDEYAYEGLNARPLEADVGGVVHAYNVNRTYSFRITNSGTDSSVTLRVDRLAQKLFSPAMSTWVCTGSGAGVPFGSVNFNEDYTRMAVVLGGSGCDTSANAGRLLVYDVNTSTDEITERANIVIGSRTSPTYVARSMGYSADFSPSGRYVYVSKIYPGELYRYDVTSNNATTIKNSEWFIGNTNCQSPQFSAPYNRCISTYRPVAISYPYSSIAPYGGATVDGGGQVLRGPDGRMYVADRGSQYISVVNSPDVATKTVSAIGWQYGSVNLGNGNYSMYGLPQMVSLYSPRSWQF